MRRLVCSSFLLIVSCIFFHKSSLLVAKSRKRDREQAGLDHEEPVSSEVDDEDDVDEDGEPVVDDGDDADDDGDEDIVRSPATKQRRIHGDE